MIDSKSTGKRKVGDGTPGPGRGKGTPNKTTTALKEAILLAAEAVGSDGKGAEGLTGYLKTLAVQQPKSFASLLGRVLPLQLSGPNGGPIDLRATALSDDELAAIAAGKRAHS